MKRASALALALLAWGAMPASAQRSLFDQPVAETPPPAASGSAPRPAAPSAASPAAPATEAPAPRARPRRPSGPTPARSLAINNASGKVLTALEVTGDGGRPAKLARPLASAKKTSLKLPNFKNCTVSVVATFEGQPAETSEIDICKEKAIRFTE